MTNRKPDHEAAQRYAETGTYDGSKWEADQNLAVAYLDAKALFEKAETLLKTAADWKNDLLDDRNQLESILQPAKTQLEIAAENMRPGTQRARVRDVADELDALLRKIKKE